MLRGRQLSLADAELCSKWVTDGYVTIEGLIDSATIDRAWADYEQAIAEGKVTPQAACEVNGLPGRNLIPHTQVQTIEALLKDPRITRIISMLLGAKCLPFQTITGHNGSE